MKIPLLFAVACLGALTSCHPFYEADAETWRVGVTGTHRELLDTATSIVQGVTHGGGK